MASNYQEQLTERVIARFAGTVEQSVLDEIMEFSHFVTRESYKNGRAAGKGKSATPREQGSASVATAKA